MKFGVFSLHQLPRPWAEGDEARMFEQALESVELADALGFDHAWGLELHFLEEYSHSSAPEVFLAACSQRTRNIRLGHGLTLPAPAINHPARIAEQIATLDLISGGRVEWGTSEGASMFELEGFGLLPRELRDQWREAVEQCARMMAMTPYPGFDGRYFSMPSRNVVPKPAQKPHPPLWMACVTRESVKAAGRLGMGAMIFTYIDPGDAKAWVNDYYRAFREECCPIGMAVNPNVCLVSPLGLHTDESEARRRFEDGFRFLRYALHWHQAQGAQRPGITDIWSKFQEVRKSLPRAPGAGIGAPAELLDQVRELAAAGVDQIAFFPRGGRTTHDDACRSMRLFADEIMPEFKARAALDEQRKREELEPYVAMAMRRKQRLKPAQSAAPATQPDTANRLS